MMEDQPLSVFAQERTPPPLRLLRDALKNEGYPVSLSIDIAGDANSLELDARDWEAAFLRWLEPELHEALLVERLTRGEDEQAETAIQSALELARSRPQSAGQMIVTNHLEKTQAVYVWQIMPPLLADEDHPAWAALDVALRTLAENTEGIIYAYAEGFYDADGEMLLTEDDEVEWMEAGGMEGDGSD